MAFCSNCGAPVEGRFCAKCGTSQEIGAAGSGPVGAQPQYSAVAANAGLTENVASGLCYLVGFITGILFLVLAPYNQNRNIRFHAFQSIFLNAAWIAFWIVFTMLSVIMPWFVQAILGVLSLLISLGFFVLWLIVMIKAFQGQRFVVPVVGPLAEKQA